MSALEVDEPRAFTLPPELEAHEPPEARGLARDEVRLLVTRRDGRIEHARFRELPRFSRDGDLVVINTSATIPAALKARRGDGTLIDLHLSGRLADGSSLVEPRKTQAFAGEVIALPEHGTATMLAPYRDSHRLWTARLELPRPLLDYLHAWGRAIRYPYVARDWPMEMYQTVYATEPGSAEMPSAGRPFSDHVIAALLATGVRLAPLVVHTGVASLEGDEAPYEEWYCVPHETAQLINETRREGGRVIAVGTTVVRALESSLDANGHVHESHGWTDLVITPRRGVGVVDGMLTGFHEPKATHLDMLEAVAGKDLIARAYGAALEGRYLWHEFGDVHLII